MCPFKDQNPNVSMHLDSKGLVNSKADGDRSLSVWLGRYRWSQFASLWTALTGSMLLVFVFPLNRVDNEIIGHVVCSVILKLDLGRVKRCPGLIWVAGEIRLYSMIDVGLPVLVESISKSAERLVSDSKVFRRP
jgi:hypothetical protein